MPSRLAPQPASQDTDPATLLAARLCSRAFREQVRPVLSHVELVVADTIAAIVADDEPGSFEQIVTLLAGCGADLDAATGTATALVERRRTSALAAAVLNGAHANATLLAEGHRAAGGHPAAHVVPAALAAAEAVDATGEALLLAVAAGYEAAVRYRQLAGPPGAGVSPNGNWPTVGAAAAVAYLLTGGDPAAVSQALNAAGALALSGPMTFGHTGAEMYRLFVGLGAGIGLSVGTAAADGWTAPPAWPDSHSARVPVQARGSEHDNSAPLAVTENYFKRYAVCAHVAAAADAAAALHGRVGIDQVISVEVRCGTASAAELSARTAPNRFAARYSIPLACATALVHGGQALLRYDTAVIRDERVAQLAAATTVVLDEALGAAYPHGRPTQVRLRTRAGDTHIETVPVPVGDAQNPLPSKDVRNKITTLIGAAIGPHGAGAVVDALSATGTGTARDVTAPFLRVDPERRPARTDADNTDKRERGTLRG